MFPQTELDNYKLQVELLQERLQRSEISRQQLEHKLEKILTKREEHEKLVRLKSKKKCQQFLEEQQRRNERNKQLVKMLERIEQQTSAMNARSERLKMMKLQYEMYFAKLVHSQTRRCLQTSAAGATVMGPTSIHHRAVAPNMMMPAMTPRDGLNYNASVYDDQPPFLGNSYRSFSETSLNRDAPQQGLQREPPIVDPALSDYTLKSERSDSLDMRKPEPYLLRQQSYDANVTISDYDERNQQHPDEMSISGEPIFYSSQDFQKRQNYLPSQRLLDGSKRTFEMDMPTTSSSSTNGLILDRNARSDMLYKSPINLKESPDTHKILPSDDNHNIQKQNLIQNSTQLEPTKYQTTTDPMLSELSLNTTSNSEQNSDNKPTYSENLQMPQEAKINSTSENKNETDLVHKEILAQKASEMETKLPKALTTNENIAENLNTAQPVSLENIENAIYGELVSPVDQMKKRQENTNRVVPELLENLVTQPPEISETNTVISQPAEEVKETSSTAPVTTKYDEIPTENSQLPGNTDNYDQAYDYNTSNTNLYTEDGLTNADGQQNANVDYTGYEINNKTSEDVNQQEQQQYDYSNYDPSQYSYPGYIYDETTGEYKPDPNASAEQYATDQQYAQGYDQQYQQEGYDYSQAYEQAVQQSNELDPAAYTNYDTTAQELEQTTASAEPDKVEQNVPNLEQTQESDTAIPEQELESPDAQASAVASENSGKNAKPTSILSTTEKNEQQKKKKRVNFVDSSETDGSSVEKGATQANAAKPLGAANESDFDFSSGSETGAKPI